ncbi:MAG: hypothetical protein ABIG94_04870 [Pseudomonadota bacterium]
MRFLELFSTKRSCRLLVNLEGEIVAKYKNFKEFLNYNYQALNLLAELEQTYYTGSPFSMGLIEKQGRELLACTRHLVQALDGFRQGQIRGPARGSGRPGARAGAPLLPGSLLPHRGTGPASGGPDA